MLFGLIIPLLFSCSGTKQTFSTTENTALFLPPKIDSNVEMYIDEIDGKKTEFNLADSAQVDYGNHSVLVRLEYQPASGTAIIVGGFANLLLRATTNKTFTSILDIKVNKGQEYRFVVKDFEDGFEIVLFNESTSKEESIHKFKLTEGKFEREF